MCVKYLLANSIGCSAVVLRASFLENHIPSPTCRRLEARLTLDTSKYSAVIFIFECYDHILLNYAFGLFILPLIRAVQSPLTF